MTAGACRECGGSGHPRTIGHRFVTDCEWPVPPCPSAAFRGLEGVNVFGKHQRHFYCESHLTDIMSGRAYRRTLDQAVRLGLTSDIARPDVVAANAALTAHQDRCEPCAGVRRWTLEEMGAGRVQTIEDRNRVGIYTLEHACAEGIPLYEAVGRAMMTGGPA